MPEWETAATLSGIAAAWWHGLWPRPPALVEITIPHHRRLSPRPGIRVVRRDLGPADRVEVNGLWLTAAPLTVLEAAVALGAAGSQLLDRALQRRVTVAGLYATHYRNLGRRGSAAAQLLQASGDRAASEAERLLLTLLRQASLSGWRSGYRVEGYELDIAFPEERIAVEVDGWAFHSDVERFRGDRPCSPGCMITGMGMPRSKMSVAVPFRRSTSVGE